MKHIVLHVGMSKSGSTAIQKTLASNRRLLSKHSLHFASIDDGTLRWANHGRAFGYAFGSPADLRQFSIRDKIDGHQQKDICRAEIDDALENKGTIIFSGEAISTLNRNSLTDMRNYFQKRNLELRIIYFVRSPSEFLESGGQEHIRQGFANPMPASALRKYFEWQIGNFQSLFPETEFHPYSEVIKHPKGAAGYFLDLLVPGLSDNVETLVANTRSSANSIELLKWVNSFVPMRAGPNSKTLNPLRQHGDLHSLYTLSGPPFRLSKRDLASARDLLDKQIDWVQSNLGAKFVESGTRRPKGRLVWTDTHAEELQKAFKTLSPHLSCVLAEYFRDKDDIPKSIKTLCKNQDRPMRLSVRYFAKSLLLGANALLKQFWK